MIGRTTAPGTVYDDPDTGKPAVFFVLQHLSIRVQGDFRLRVDVMNMSKPSFHFHDIECSSLTDSSRTVYEGNPLYSKNVYDKPMFETMTVITEPFEVFPPKEFPGRDPPTKLVKALLAQGMKLYPRMK